MTPKKMNLKQVKYLIYALCAAILAAVAVGYLLQSLVLVAIAVGLCVAGIAINLALWRCPDCGEHLGQTQGGKYCPHCGRHLVDLE